MGYAPAARVLPGRLALQSFLINARHTRLSREKDALARRLDILHFFVCPAIMHRYSFFAFNDHSHSQPDFRPCGRGALYGIRYNRKKVWRIG